MIGLPLKTDPFLAAMLGQINAELNRKEPLIIGASYVGSNLVMRYRAPFGVGWIQAQVQSSVTGGMTYDPVTFVSSVEVDCRADRMQTLTVAMTAGVSYAVFLVPVQYDGAGTKVLYNGVSSNPDAMAKWTTVTGTSHTHDASTLTGTTLNATVVTSSLTTVGTIGTGVWQGTAVAAGYGGTAQANVVLGDVLYGSLADTWSRLAGNITTTRKFLAQTGTGAVSAAPAWTQPLTTDVAIAGGVGTPTYDDVQDFLRMTRSAGRLTGGTITAYVSPPTADGKVSISAMEGMIFTTNALGGDYIFFKQAAATLDFAALADNSVFWVYYDWNAGTPRYLATVTRSDINEYNQFAVGRVWRSGTTVEVQSTGHNLYDKDRRAHNRLMLKYGKFGLLDALSGTSGQMIPVSAVDVAVDVAADADAG